MTRHSIWTKALHLDLSLDLSPYDATKCRKEKCSHGGTVFTESKNKY
jgi:hypothetical protein